MTTELVRGALLALGLTLSLGYGCHSLGAKNAVYIDTKKIPAELRADYASFATNCSKCHSLARVFNAHVTSSEHWNWYVARMMRTAGSAISPHEAPKILRFLHWYTRSYDKEDGVTSELEAAPSFDSTRAPVSGPGDAPPATHDAEGEGQR